MFRTEARLLPPAMYSFSIDAELHRQRGEERSRRAQEQMMHKRQLQPLRTLDIAGREGATLQRRPFHEVDCKPIGTGVDLFRPEPPVHSKKKTKLSDDACLVGCIVMPGDSETSARVKAISNSLSSGGNTTMKKVSPLDFSSALALSKDLPPLNLLPAPPPALRTGRGKGTQWTAESWGHGR